MKKESTGEDVSELPDDATPGLKRQIYQFFRWSAFFGGIAWCAWAGVHGNEGAGRLLAFVAWTFGVILFYGGTVDVVRASAAKRGRSVPAWLSHGAGILLICFLVWHGWWWTAIAWLLAELGCAAIHSKPSSPCH